MLRGVCSAGARGVALASRRSITPYNTFTRLASTTPKPGHSDAHAPATHDAHTHTHAATAHGHGHGPAGAHDAHHDGHGHGEHGHVDLSPGHDHHDHHHIDHSNAPYGIMFGEVYEGKRKIPAWEWIYYVGFGLSVAAVLYVYRDFDERKIQTWAKNTYAQAVEDAAKIEEKLGTREERDAQLARFGTKRKEQ